MYKRFYQAGFTGYLSLLILSIIFYKERTVFADIAYHLFEILRTGRFAIQNHRFGAVATQIFPLIGRSLSLELNTIAILYSIGFILYYSLCYFICGSIFKGYKFALAYLLICFLFASHTFYWMQSELPQGIAFMMVFFVFLSTQSLSAIKPVILALMFGGIVAIVFFHPLLVFPFIFVVLFFLLSKETIIDRKLLTASLVFYILIFLLKKYVITTVYESGALSGTDRIWEGEWFNTHANRRFISNCLTKYYWIPVSFVGISLFYLAKRHWKKLALFVCFFGGYLFLINTVYSDATVRELYIENLYLPLGIFLAFPIVFDLLPLLKKREKLAMGILLLVVFSGLVRIVATRHQYTERLKWERQFLSEHKNEKLIVDHHKVPSEMLLFTSGTPYEFWLLSTMEQDTSASIVISDNADGLSWAIDSKKAFVATWGLFPYEQLPLKYFRFFDTTNTYINIR